VREAEMPADVRERSKTEARAAEKEPVEVNHDRTD
jgi:hypothetical protein